MSLRSVSALLLGAFASLLFASPSRADQASIISQVEFDPWGAPELRWPDPYNARLGGEETYYYWTRDDQRALLPQPTETKPLHVWVGGDSLAGGASLGFRILTANEDRWIYTEDVRKSTGVVTDWYFDWIEYLREEVADGPYQVVVLSMGGNDWQGFREGSSEKGAAEWVQKYGSRLTEMLTILDRPGRLVIWVGLPHFRIPFMVPLPDAVNPISRQVFQNGNRSEWVDAAAIVSPDGVWTKYILDDDGTRIEVRTDDGTHYQPDGARLITAAVISAIEGRAG
ncbi:MAG: DUF459 domain-containing protein [Actinomycetota bacterium]|nr:DUF459 domain-containing protein [Actinomycetota bacterium]